jgi:hypothetical protein
MDNAFAAADRFVLSQARLLERRLFATVFLGQPAARVVDALRGYQNDDGGFGQALEPDTRCPASLPIYVEVAFQALAAARAAGHGTAGDGTAADGAAEFGAASSGMVERACDFLARTAKDAAAGGAVPLAFPIIESFPRAAHWSEWTYEPGLNPTAGLVGLLYKLGVDHPWRADGAAYCWHKLDSGELPGDAHALSETFLFLEHVPDRDRADKHAAVLAANLADIPMLNLDPDATDYGLSPLHLAPEPGSRWRELFTDSQIDAHLGRLVRDQQSDGGWPISWEPPGEAAVCEWRGMVTVQALRTLTSYGRLSP